MSVIIVWSFMVIVLWVVLVRLVRTLWCVGAVVCSLPSRDRSGVAGGVDIRNRISTVPLDRGISREAQGVERLTLTFCFAPRLSSSRL
jgi:hypothetical protein